MKPVIFGTAIMLMTIIPAIGGDVPFAEPPASNGHHPDALPGLGEIMSIAQLRHIKLWYAGKAGNWALADYELDRMQENLNKAVRIYLNIPVEEIQAANGPLADMRSAIQAGNAEAFARGYAGLTAACNSCHGAGGVGFIHIQTPTSSPFSDEDYGGGKP